MLSRDALTARRAMIDESPDLSALRDHLVERAQPLLARMPIVPEVKALLSRDGGTCPDDGTVLEFDPWSPDAHRCSRCGGMFTGARHHAHWARAQHLWIAERAAHLATVHAVTGDAATAGRARDLLAAYFDRYFALPNRDNVLGPSHLFFSTYLESIWVLDYLAAAYLLREMDCLDDTDIARIDAIAEEAATLIAEFNEGLSNRQTWHAAALTAIAAWFGDHELAETAIEGRTGLLGHLADGFGDDGMWYEGENYHLFAMRGLLIGLRWADTAGADLLADEAVAKHLGDALLAPADTALPDLTFPARKDARFGVSLAHPAYIESWEAGRAALKGREPADLVPWLRALYAVPPRTEQSYDAWLHDAGEAPPHFRSRTRLSWWALLTMEPSLPNAVSPWVGRTRLLEQQGLAILRHGTTFVALECGGGGSGHAHPDRLQFLLHAGGTYWLPDPGAGSYTSADLFWYRSTLAHNAPLLDAESQPPGDRARCAAFAASGDWSWAVGEWHDLRRAVLLGPRWIVDLVQLDAAAPHSLDLPWHFAGATAVLAAGTWLPEPDRNSFVAAVERLESAGEMASGRVRLSARSDEGQVTAWFAGDGSLWRAMGPGLPGAAGQAQFHVRHADRASAFLATVIDLHGTVSSIEFHGNAIDVVEGDTRSTVLLGRGEAVVTTGSTRVVLGGARTPPLAAPSFVRDRPLVTHGQARWVDAPPALDGSLAGFVRSAPLLLDEEHHYFRSEVPFPGADELSATALVNWREDTLYLAVAVRKGDVVLRPEGAPPLNLDNEPDDINADGVELFWQLPGGLMHGWLVRPADAQTIIARPIGEPAGDMPAGCWQRTDDGYRITVAVPIAGLGSIRRNERLRFDLVVNEMQPGRMRRAGQLVWSGGPGWVYLRGDRHEVERLGELELIG